MTHPWFADPPTIALLQWLARGSLKQNLARAIRLWVWLQFLYGEEGATADLSDPFTYAEWRDAFFTASHPHDEAIPPHHDPNCRCAKTTAEWLFQSPLSIPQATWRQSLQQHDAEPQAPKSLETILRSRLFGVTRRSLYEDLQILHKLGWVKRDGQQYHRVEQFPIRPQAPTSGRSSMIVHPDLAAIADNLAQELNGHQRFFLHVDYVVPTDQVDQVDEWHNQLRLIWEQPTVPPILLTYHSAKLNQKIKKIVYPVCVYYVQRAPYLCAWGEVPDSPSGALDWRNYRLDRIQQLTPLAWTNAQIPQRLQMAYQRHTLPTPDAIQEQMAKAWGFDFYQPSVLMVLRFDQVFAQGYIQGTVRHETFQPIRYEQVPHLIQTQTTDLAQQQELLQVWRSRSPQDAYYSAQYRLGDPNVMLRLRAWRPNMEVLLPWALRSQIAQEVAQESQFYWTEDRNA